MQSNRTERMPRRPLRYGARPQGIYFAPDFARLLRQAQILILKILNVFLWLKLSPSLFLNKLRCFEIGS